MRTDDRATARWRHLPLLSALLLSAPQLGAPQLGATVLGVTVLGATAAGCSTDKTVENASERFACSSAGDCLSGYQCACGFCQPVGATRCMDAAGTTDAGATDTGTTDTGATDTGTTDTGAADTGTTDTGPTTTDCDPVTWSGCPSGQGCYWNVSTDALFCTPHGSLKEGATCDPAIIHTCGKSAAGKPLLCDAVDSRCYPLCRSGQDKCGAGETCFALQDGDTKKVWPKDAGICAK